MGDPPVSDISSKKYDRQVRVWGAHGQAALERCRVCCLGATALPSEVMKNLVLGGIAGFTLVDDAKVGFITLGGRFPRFVVQGTMRDRKRANQ
jgi:NEDD8-activating enzyme E1 regulatory subunit